MTREATIDNTVNNKPHSVRQDYEKTRPLTAYERSFARAMGDERITGYNLHHFIEELWQKWSPGDMDFVDNMLELQKEYLEWAKVTVPNIYHRLWNYPDVNAWVREEIAAGRRSHQAMAAEQKTARARFTLSSFG